MSHRYGPVNTKITLSKHCCADAWSGNPIWIRPSIFYHLFTRCDTTTSLSRSHLHLPGNLVWPILQQSYIQSLQSIGPYSPIHQQADELLFLLLEERSPLFHTSNRSHHCHATSMARSWCRLWTNTLIWERSSSARSNQALAARDSHLPFTLIGKK